MMVFYEDIVWNFGMLLKNVSAKHNTCDLYKKLILGGASLALYYVKVNEQWFYTQS